MYASQPLAALALVAHWACFVLCNCSGTCHARMQVVRTIHLKYRQHSASPDDTAQLQRDLYSHLVCGLRQFSSASQCQISTLSVLHQSLELPPAATRLDAGLLRPAVAYTPLFNNQLMPGRRSIHLHIRFPLSRGSPFGWQSSCAGSAAKRSAQAQLAAEDHQNRQRQTWLLP